MGDRLQENSGRDAAAELRRNQVADFVSKTKVPEPEKSINPWIWIVVATALVIGVYTATEWSIRHSIRRSIESAVGKEYAILALHIGGKNAAKPSLWRMLIPLVDYQVPGRYPPQGSGGFTGKYYYLTMLLSDNESLVDGHWSWVEWSFVIGTGRAPWDYVASLPREDQAFYTFNDNNIRQKGGLRYHTTVLNHPEISFYYRQHIEPPANLEQDFPEVFNN